MPDEPNHTSDRDGDESTRSESDLPADVADEAARLTRLALDATERDPGVGPYHGEGADATRPDEATVYDDRRDELLAHFGYVARVREERDGGSTLVCYPAEWLDDDGVVRLGEDLDTSRAVELPLTGTGEQGDFETAAAANDELVEAVHDAHGEDHAANVRAFADFMSNHYARPATSASAAEVREFLNEYYPRNAWPTETQTAIVETSLRSAFELRNKVYPPD